MDYVLPSLRLAELMVVVNENKRFFEEFVQYLQEEGYGSIVAFAREGSDERAEKTIVKYLERPGDAILYDGLLRPYPNSKAKWYFLAWLFRDAATQRLEPLLKTVPGDTLTDRKAYLLNEIRKFVELLFPEEASWQWPALSEVMLTRLEGSRRALKGSAIEGMLRKHLVVLIEAEKLPLDVSSRQVKIGDETYDIQVKGEGGILLLPVKTRETMGGGHSLLFTRDIYKSIRAAVESGYSCVPVVIAESWAGNLTDLRSDLYLYLQVNPNQISLLETMLSERLRELLPILRAIAGQSLINKES